MQPTNIDRIVGIVALGVVAYQYWGIYGVIAVIGFALCHKI